jgi:hypothetical protein
MRTVSLFPYAITALIVALFVPHIASAQIPMTPEQAEETKNRFNKAIEERVLRVLQGIEVTEEQLGPMQEALIQFFVPMQIEQAKMQAERREMQAEGGGPTTRDRQAIMQRWQKLQKLRGDLNKKVKVILDKKQYKSFQSTIENLMPQPRRAPRGRGGR